MTNIDTGDTVAYDVYDIIEEAERFVYNEQISVHNCYYFTIYDSYGDGLSGEGYYRGNYTVKLDDNVVKFGSTFGYNETTKLNACRSH